MTYYYIGIYDNGSLAIDLIQDIIDRSYGNNKNYRKSINTYSNWIKEGFFYESTTLTNTVWDWNKIENVYFHSIEI